MELELLRPPALLEDVLKCGVASITDSSNAVKMSRLDTGDRGRWFNDEEEDEESDRAIGDSSTPPL